MVSEETAMGGNNTFQYAPNPTGWIDLFGLEKNKNDCCRTEWKVSRYDMECTNFLNGTQVKYFRTPTHDKNKKQFWWSKDTEGHGGSVWKVMLEAKGKLVHYSDADEYGDFIVNKHKGGKGKVMDMQKMQCKKVKQNK